MSELFALKWRDINFQANEISITRSIAFQVVGPCKTEASQKPIPLDAYLAEALRTWRGYTPYQKPDDWVFASPATSGKNPYWGQTMMRSFIRPAAVKIGVAHIGWHTFRHYVWNAPERERRKSKGRTGVVAPRESESHDRRLRAGSRSAEARGTEQSGQTGEAGAVSEIKPA